MKYLGVAVSIKGTIFAHPCNSSAAAEAIHNAARERGDWPYQHLYDGDDIIAIVEALRAADE